MIMVGISFMLIFSHAYLMIALEIYLSYIAHFGQSLWPPSGPPVARATRLPYATFSMMGVADVASERLRRAG